MKKVETKNILKGFLGLFASFAVVLGIGVSSISNEPVKAEAVSNSRIYVVLNDEILARAPAYKLYNGSADKDLHLLSSIDPLHEGDIYTYYTNEVPTNWMTFKNNGGLQINLHGISNIGFGTTWDTIIFKPGTTNFNTTSEYTTSVYAPPTPVGETYAVSLYNGTTKIDTQTAYEGIVFTPKAVPIPSFKFDGWYIDPAFQTEYEPTVLTGDISLYLKYDAILLESTRVYITNTNSWWYNNNAAIKLYYSMDGSVFDYVMMTKEAGNVHSAILPHNLSKFVKFDQMNPEGTQVWNSTGKYTVNMEQNDVTLLTGQMDTGGSGTLTANNYVESSPYINDLKTNVPLLACDNYDNADVLLAKYNQLPANERRVVDALRVTAADNTEITYETVVNYYANYKVLMNGGSQARRTIQKENPINAVVFIGLVGLTAICGYMFLIKRKAN